MRYLPDSAGLECRAEVESLVQVPREEAPSQPIASLVGPLHQLLHAVKLEDLHHGPKDLPAMQGKTFCQL